MELTVQHVAKLREMSPLWEMVQVCLESRVCHSCAQHCCMHAAQPRSVVHNKCLMCLLVASLQEGIDLKSIQWSQH